MKKFLAAMLSTTILCSAMAACGNQSTTPDTDDTAQSSSSSTSTNVKGTIAVVTKTMNNPFHVTYGEAIKQAGEAAGYEVLVSGPDAETDVDKQISLIETYIEQGVSAIVTAACSSTAIVDVIEQADAKGIPVFLVDSGADGGPYVTFIGTDNYAGGQLAGEWVGENVDSGKCVILDGNSGNDATTKRVKGFSEVITDKYPKIEIVASDYANCEISKAMEVTENFLAAYPDLKVIFCANDNMAIGAGQAVAAAGLRDQIKICGFDGQPDAAQAIIDGEIDATIAQKPATMGKMVVDAIEKYEAGETVDKEVDTGCDVVTKDNAKTYLNWQ